MPTTTMTQLIILHYLCERLLHENEVVRDFAAANSEQMVHYPLGADAAFRNYWYFDGRFLLICCAALRCASLSRHRAVDRE